MRVRLTQRATTNVATVALGLSVLACTLCVWMIWVYPQRVQLQIQQIEAQRRTAQAIADQADAQTRQAEAMTELAKRLGLLTEELGDSAELKALQEQLNKFNKDITGGR